MAGFQYILNVTGDCSSTGSGIVSILPSGGTPPYTIEWVNPSLPPVNTTIDTPINRTGLYPGVYQIRLNDSSEPENLEFYVNATVSSGVCVSITSISATTCGTNSGSVVASASTYLSSVMFNLYTSGDTLISSFDSNTGTAEFSNLSAGTFYISVEDIGGCTARTSDFIILNSNPLSYGFYLVPNSACQSTNSPIGKIFVTGQTGTPPYTYLWSNNATGSTVTGLTSGFYSVTVTDANGCSLTQNTFVGTVEPLGLVNFSADTPSCFQADGALTLNVSGGTAPYYYSASTGNVEISYSQSFTLSGIPAGEYSFLVTDAGLCQIFAATNLQTPQSIGSVTVNKINSLCSNSDGEVQITVGQGLPPFTYTLVYPDSSNVSQTTNSPTKVFEGLSTGTYTVFVTDQSTCQFSETFTILTSNSYTISVTQTGTTCNQNNGSIYIQKSTGGTEPFTYFVDNVPYFINTSLSAVTINNISSGTKIVSVKDSSGCTQSQNIYVQPSVPLNFTLFSTNCGNGNDGQITAFISSGTPPFTFNWSSNVSGNPQQITVSNLTGGTYSLTITDSTGCSLLRQTTISCTGINSGYVPFVVGSDDLVVTLDGESGILEMLNDGYQDLITGYTDCDFVSANFIANVEVNPVGLVLQDSFYTGTTLVDVPSTNLWYTAVENLLVTIPGVQNVDINPLTNQITITKSKTNPYLNGQVINISLEIEYNINC